MPTAAEIRAELQAARQLREEGERKRQEGAQAARKWLSAARAHPEISVNEAVELAGVTRQYAHKVAKGEPGE